MKKMIYYGSNVNSSNNITGAMIRTKQILNLLGTNWKIYNCTYANSGVNKKGSSFLQALAYAKSYVELYTLLKNESPDLVYSLAASGLRGKIRLFLMDLIIVLSMRSPKRLVHIHTGDFYEFRRARRLLPTFEKYIYQYLVNSGFQFIALSPSLLCGPKSKEVFILPNTIDLQGFNLEEIQRKYKRRFSPQYKISFTFISNFLPGKGHEKLIEALFKFDPKEFVRFEVTLCGEFPDAKTKFWLEEKVTALKNLGCVCNLLPAIRDRDIVRSLLFDTDIIVFPTLYKSEAQPLILLEAMSAGCYAIASRHRGIPDLLIDDDLGVLLTNKVDGLFNEMSRLLDHHKIINNTLIWQYFNTVHSCDENEKLLKTIFR